MITGDSLRPDLLLNIHSKCLYTLELTIAYERNLANYISCKNGKYHDLTMTLRHYTTQLDL